MKPTIEIKDVTCFKLTKTIDSIRIKVPINSSLEEREEAITYLLSVAENIGEVKYTFRVKYKNWKTKPLNERLSH